MEDSQLTFESVCTSRLGFTIVNPWGGGASSTKIFGSKFLQGSSQSFYSRDDQGMFRPNEHFRDFSKAYADPGDFVKNQNKLKEIIILFFSAAFSIQLPSSRKENTKLIPKDKKDNTEGTQPSQLC